MPSPVNECYHLFYINYSPPLATSVLPVRRSELSAIGSMMHCSSYALKSVVTEVEQREGVSLESVAALVGEQY
jgi:hypothetical protein